MTKRSPCFQPKIGTFGFNSSQAQVEPQSGTPSRCVESSYFPFCSAVPTHSVSLNNYNSQTFAFIIQQYIIYSNEGHNTRAQRSPSILSTLYQFQQSTGRFRVSPVMKIHEWQHPPSLRSEDTVDKPPEHQMSRA